MWVWVSGIGDCGVGFFVVLWGFLVFFIGFVSFFYRFSLGFWCDRLVWILASILLHGGRPKASILREMVADDGGYVGCVGLKK